MRRDKSYYTLQELQRVKDWLFFQTRINSQSMTRGDASKGLAEVLKTGGGGKFSKFFEKIFWKFFEIFLKIFWKFFKNFRKVFSKILGFFFQKFSKKNLKSIRSVEQSWSSSLSSPLNDFRDKFLTGYFWQSTASCQ